MTSDQKNKIREMRNQGYSYGKIAVAVGVSENTVKTYCRRNQLVKDTAAAVSECIQCGNQMAAGNERTKRRFCSDKCRSAWWRSNHPDKARTSYEIKCAFCGKSFVSVGNKAQKYCSHQCYISARFGGNSHV